MAMLQRAEDAGQAQATPLRPPSGELNALLGKGSSFEGKLLFEGSVRIDGKFTGEIISSDTLIIGEGAEVKAEVKVGSLVIVGDYTGNARASKSIELKAPAKVRGTVTTASIVIERGVFFDGQCKMDMGSAPATPSAPSSPAPSPPGTGGGKK